MWKKLARTLLALVLLSVIASCGDSKVEEPTTTAPMPTGPMKKTSK